MRVLCGALRSCLLAVFQDLGFANGTYGIVWVDGRRLRFDAPGYPCFGFWDVSNRYNPGYGLCELPQNGSVKRPKFDSAGFDSSCSLSLEAWSVRLLLVRSSVSREVEISSKKAFSKRLSAFALVPQTRKQRFPRRESRRSTFCPCRCGAVSRF